MVISLSGRRRSLLQNNSGKLMQVANAKKSESLIYIRDITFALGHEVKITRTQFKETNSSPIRP
jgi:hypothetical protein